MTLYDVLTFFFSVFFVVVLNSLTLTILFSYIWNLFVLINRGLFRKKIRGSPAKNPQLQLLARKRRGVPRGRPGMVSMARKIFVGSLPQSITEDQLRQEFETYGEVEAIFIKD